MNALKQSNSRCNAPPQLHLYARQTKRGRLVISLDRQPLCGASGKAIALTARRLLVLGHDPAAVVQIRERESVLAQGRLGDLAAIWPSRLDSNVVKFPEHRRLGVRVERGIAAQVVS